LTINFKYRIAILSKSVDIFVVIVEYWTFHCWYYQASIFERKDRSEAREPISCCKLVKWCIYRSRWPIPYAVSICTW